VGAEHRYSRRTSRTLIPTGENAPGSCTDRGAGLGNIYKSEILFLSGLAPTRRVGDVHDLRKVVHLAQRLIVANRDRPLRVTTGVARKGRQYWVYGRAGQQCRRCGTPVLSEMTGPANAVRVTFWCPACQPAGS
jgi:endonuclease-8